MSCTQGVSMAHRPRPSSAGTRHPLPHSSLDDANCPCATKSSTKSVTTGVPTRTFFEASQEADILHQKENRACSSPRPDSDALPLRAGLDRSANVWIPHGQSSSPGAWDFAVTLCPGILACSTPERHLAPHTRRHQSPPRSAYILVTAS